MQPSALVASQRLHAAVLQQLACIPGAPHATHACTRRPPLLRRPRPTARMRWQRWARAASRPRNSNCCPSWARCRSSRRARTHGDAHQLLHPCTCQRGGPSMGVPRGRHCRCSSCRRHRLIASYPAALPTDGDLNGPGRLAAAGGARAQRAHRRHRLHRQLLLWHALPGAPQCCGQWRIPCVALGWLPTGRRACWPPSQQACIQPCAPRRTLLCAW